MLTGAAIEVSSTPLPRAVPLTPGAAAGGSGGNLSAVNSANAEDTQGSSWKQQQKFAAVAAEKKDKMPVYAYQPEESPSPKGAAGAKAGVGRVGAGGSSSSSSASWSDNRTQGTAAPSTTAVPASAERSWRASYASSLYCLLPAWLLRFRGPAYSPLRDDACATAASSTLAASSSCGGSSIAAAAGSATAGGGGAAGGTETPSFGDAPFSTVCLHCHKAIITTVAFKISCLGICLCLLSPLLLGWPGLCLSPFLYIALKDAVHTCPQCRNLIHRQSRVSVPFFGLRDEVVTVKCGNCAVVLSRRYLLLFAALLLLILLFYILRAGWLGSSLDVISKGPPANMSWQQFYEQCGQRSQLGNSLKAGANFRESFAGKTVEWKGLVKQVKEGFFSSNVLLVVMSPTITLSGGGGGPSSSTGEGDSSGSSSDDESSSSSSNEEREKFSTETGTAAEGGVAGHKEDHSSSGREDGDDLEEEAKAMQGDGADLALAFNGSELIEKIEKLEPGDKIEFEATLVALGRRGKPSLGRLWNVSLIEKREAREARLEEWRAKKAERQHLLQRLLLPLMGSPFSDFGFDPFSSFFSSTGSLGGRGVMVIRRQIISPGASFSVISSSSDEEPGMGIPSVFEGTGSFSIESINSRRHGDADETQQSDKDTGRYADAHEMLAGLGGVRGGPLGTQRHYGFAGKFGDDRPTEGEHLMFHVDDEDEEEHSKGAPAGEMKLEQQQTEEKPHSHGTPAWSRGASDANTLPWTDSRHAESRGHSGLYFHINDDESEEHQDVVGGGAGAAHGVAATASPGAEVKYEKKLKTSQQSHHSTTEEEEEEGDLTLAALKLAVERQRQQRAQKEEVLEQQRQQRAPQASQKQPEHWQHRHAQHENQQASVVEREKGDKVKVSPDTFVAPLAENLQGHTQLQQNLNQKLSEGEYVKRSGEAGRGTQPTNAAYVPTAAGVQHEQEQQQMEDVYAEDGSTAYETKAPSKGDGASVQSVQQQNGEMVDAQSAERRDEESSSNRP